MESQMNPLSEKYIKKILEHIDLRASLPLWEGDGGHLPLKNPLKLY